MIDSTIEKELEWGCIYAADIREHLPVLKQYASTVKHITEFGVRDVISTWALLAGRPEKLISYDVNDTPHAERCRIISAQEGLDWRFIIKSTLEADIEPTDLLFIDTWHTYDQLRQELALHAGKVSTYIMLHDTTSWEHKSEFIEGSTKGLWDAVNEFLASHPEWVIRERFTNNNGMTILERVKDIKSHRKVSIVIPTWNHLDDMLKPCIASVERNTSARYDVEFIIVANGCTDGTEQYLEELNAKNPTRYKYYATPEQIGFTKAANIGFKMATSDHIMIFNNDIIILDWGRDMWLDKLFAPFDQDPQMAAVGALKLHDPYSQRDFLVGFCVLYRADLLKQFGYFDEIYSPAAGEDVDICIKFQDAGYKIACTQETVYNGMTNVGDYPMWHINNVSYGSIKEYTNEIMPRNGLINMYKHNKHIKLNMGSGGVEFPGYLSVDLYDGRAILKADIAKPMPMFKDNSIEEILLSHVFEHLNPYHVEAALREWHRMLKPGGKLVIEVPNLEVLCKRFTQGDRAARYGVVNCIYGSVNTTSEGTPEDITAPHLFGWWPESIWEYLNATGYIKIVFLPEQIHHPVIPEDNMRVECYKPGLLPDEETEKSKREPVMNVTQSVAETTGSTATRKELFVMNTYNAEKQEVEGKHVVDIGAYDGASALYFVHLGAKQVSAFELNPDNYKRLCDNTKGFQNVKAFNIGVYSDGTQYVQYEGEGSTCKTVIEGGSPKIQSTSISSMLRSLPEMEHPLLKIDCEGAEFPIIMGTSIQDLRRFEIIYMEIHGEETSGHKIDELIKYLAEAGFEPHHFAPHDIFYYEKDMLGEVIFSKLIAQTYKFIRVDNPVNVLVENPANPYGVTAYISTKDRYFTTLPIAIMGIANQTWKVDELIIFDDGEQSDLRMDSFYGNLFKYLEMKNISWRVLFGQRKGQVANHQLALDIAKTEFIWRVDDDNFPEQNVLELLMMWITTPPESDELPIGAVGSLIRVPNQEIFALENCSGDIQRCIDTPNLQWSAFNGVRPTDHLHNTFLYRKSAARHGYQKDLSVVGHREETLFSHGIRVNGYRLLVIGDATTWHFRESKGGIRAYKDTELWEHDEKIFREEMKKRGILFDKKKYIVLDNGVGDHYAFKHILNEFIEKYGKENLVLSTCFPEVFEDTGVKQISIADANMLFGDITRFNVYHWMWRHQWDKHITDAYRRMYL